MPLVRGHHAFDNHFTQIPNSWLRDTRLTLKARGLLSLVMSHSQGWSLSISRLAEESLEGKDAIRSAITELEKFGYLSRSQENQGRFGENIWVTHDPADYPLAENPMTENPTPKNNNIKEKQIKNNKSEELFTEFWNAYPRKLDKAKAFRAFRSALKRAKFEDILAGVIAYRNDPKRNPDFTKYPATWLNSDAWENAATTPEAREAIEARRAKEKEFTDRLLKEQEELARKASAPPKCKHGESVARCRKCLKE